MSLSPDQAFDRIAQIMGCKWSVLILDELSEGAQRPSELLKKCPDVAPRVLHRCLNRLERDGLIQKETFNEIPPKVEYSLTEQGQSFYSLLKGARDLAKQWEGRQPKVLRA